MRLGMKQADAQDLYAVTDEGQLRSAVDHVEQRLKNKSLAALQSPVAYLRDAIKIDDPDNKVRVGWATGSAASR